VANCRHALVSTVLQICPAASTHLQHRVQLYNDYKLVTGQQREMGRVNPWKGFASPPGEYKISKLWEWDVWFSAA